MTCDELFKRISRRPDVADIPLSVVIKLSIIAFEEFIKMQKEMSYVEKFQSESE